MISPLIPNGHSRTAIVPSRMTFSKLWKMGPMAKRARVIETKGDNYVHEVILDLNKVFITPIEREDILALSMSMDDVLDGLEHTAAMFDFNSR